MKKNIKTSIVCLIGFLLFALFCGGCVSKKCRDEKLPLSYTGSQSYEYYDVGNDRNAEYLSGRASEVCVLSNNTSQDVQAEKDGYVYGLYQVSTNTVLQEYEVTKKVYPASITKLLTTLVALKQCNLSETVTFSYNASHLGIYGAIECGFEEGDQVMLGDLLAALLIFSGNDAAIAVAEHVSGSVEAFSELMNEEAHKIGAVDTYFVNPHGLHDINQYTTAYDMYLVFNELIHYNKFLSIISSPSYEVNYVDAKGNAKTMLLETTNLFFNGKFEVPDGIEIIGGKSGTTYAAGCCLTLYFKDKEGNSYIAEVFHAPSYEILYGKMVEMMEFVASQL